ncbi:hypothetical protein V8G54_017033 [Vigna mungo]|uniref:WAT1-related protein n=1 Tax=Vigna mungo TaxID=3915 RepID=A0AAQ3NQ85_VIGMU
MTRSATGTGKLLPFIGMMVAMLGQSGSMVVIKVAIKDINEYVMVVYTFALSAILVLPFAVFLHRFSFSLHGKKHTCFHRLVSKFNTNILYNSHPIFLIFTLFIQEVTRSSYQFRCTLQILFARFLWVSITFSKLLPYVLLFAVAFSLQYFCFPSFFL